MKRLFAPLVSGALLALILLALGGCSKRPDAAPATTPGTENLSASVQSPRQTNDSWRQFRGANQGHAPVNAQIPVSWGEGTNVAWKTEIPGSGASSPVLSDGKIWITSSTGEDRSLRALAVDSESGALLINQEVFALEVAPAKHRVNSPASPTPVTEDGRVYVWFGRHGIASLDAESGEVLWKNTELDFNGEDMGPGASPIIAGDHLILSCDGVDTRFIAGLEKKTGKVQWKTERSNKIAQAIPYRKAFSTPIYSEFDGVPQVISSSSYRLFSYDPKTGAELWAVEIPGFCPIPVPIVEHNRIYVCTGYNRAELWALEVQEKGKPPERLWKVSRSISLISSPISVSNHIFLVSQEGIASCLDKEKGKTVWNERLGGAYWASPVHSNGLIYFFAENGTTTIVAAEPEFKVVAKNTLEGEMFATPALTRDSMFLRTRTHLYRLRSSDPSTEPVIATRTAGNITEGER